MFCTVGTEQCAGSGQLSVAARGRHAAQDSRIRRLRRAGPAVGPRSTEGVSSARSVGFQGLFGGGCWVPRRYDSGHLCTRRVRVEATIVSQTVLNNKVAYTEPNLAYEIVQGTESKTMRRPPTAVMLHGVMGARRNLKSFAQLLAREAPQWQFILVDLRCHGESTPLWEKHKLISSSNTVASAAADIHALLRQLRIIPRALIGHSFGAKVALSMIEQAIPLPWAIQVWVLDTAPGPLPPGGFSEGDSPADLIAYLRQLQMPLPSRDSLVHALRGAGFTDGVAQWAATNLTPAQGMGGGVDWIFNLDGIAEMYASYEECNMWPLVESLPEGAKLNFVKAERSLHKWEAGEYERLRKADARAATLAGNIKVHDLPNSGHWVHADNPKGLLEIMAPTFAQFMTTV